MIIGLSWLQENDFCINTTKCRIWRQSDNQNIVCRERKIPRIEIISANDRFAADKTVIIINIAIRYAAYAKLWSSNQANKLPQHIEFDHPITFKDPEARPPIRPMYKMIWEEEEALRAYMAEHQPNGKVRLSTSPIGSPILFARKADGTLCLCVDYRSINQLVEPNRYPIPLMDKLYEKTADSTWFTKLDLKNGYYLIRIKKGDEWKTAFKTKLGLFKYIVMPFGLANTPATF